MGTNPWTMTPGLDEEARRLRRALRALQTAARVPGLPDVGETVRREARERALACLRGL